MKKGYTLNELIKIYGEPVLRFSPTGNFTKDHYILCYVPIECIVFKKDVNKYNPIDIVVCSRFGRSKYSENTEWVISEGERWVIRELLVHLKKHKTSITDFIDKTSMSTRLHNILRSLHSDDYFVEDITVKILDQYRLCGKKTKAEFFSLLEKKRGLI